MGSHLFAPALILLSLVYSLLSPLSHVGVEARGTNATLDFCLEDSDCRPGLICGRAFGNIFESCPGFSNGDNPCYCLNFSPTSCNATNYICPPGEGCGRHKVKNFQFCVSCTALSNSTSNYEPIKGAPVCKFTPTPLPTPSSSPGPPRRKLDLCSDVDVCESPLVCTGHGGSDCSLGNQPCYCLLYKKSQGTCATASDCPHPEETCLRLTHDNSTTCGSCTRLKTDPSYIPVDDDDDTCEGFITRNVPQYITETSGLSFDFCSSNRDCVKPLVCAGSYGVPCRKKGFIFCQCQGVGYAPQLCNSTSECLSGEVCVKIRGVPPAVCLSLSQYYLSPLIYHVEGEIPPRGNLVSYDDCTHDEQCMEGLYCTHLSEATLGGCLYRRGCSCTPPASVQCSSSANCRTGESCARVPGAKSEPECLSTSLLSRSPYFRDVSQSIDPTPTVLPTDGWLYDACKQDEDCKQDDVKRFCLHYTETTGSCNGRDMCVCKQKNGEELDCESASDCGAGETCSVIVDSKKSSDPSCISTKVLQLDYFIALFVTVCDGRRGPAITPSSSPSELATPPASVITPTHDPATISPSISLSVSISISPSVSPSPTLMPSTDVGRRICYAKCRRRFQVSK